MLFCAGILETIYGCLVQSLNRVTVPARRLNRLAESIPGLLQSFKMHTGSELVSLPQNGSERHSFFFVARKGISSCVLFRGMVRNGIPRICIYFGSTERNSELCLRRRVRNRIMGIYFYFWSTEWNSELFSLQRKGSDRNFEIFCSAEQPEFRLFRLPRNHFLTEIPNPSRNLLSYASAAP